MMQRANPAPPRPLGRALRLPAAPAAALFVVGSPLAMAQPPTERVEHAVEIPADAVVTIMNFAGHVEVHGTDPGEDRILRVIGIKRLADDAQEADAARIFQQVNLNLRHRGRRIHIGPNRPRRGTDRRPPDGRAARQRGGDPPVSGIRPPRRIPPVSVDLEVWLPDGASLEVRTFTAPITVTDISSPDGDFLLRSVSGAVRISDLRTRALEAETVSGELNLTNIRCARASLQTLTAAVRLNGMLHADGAYAFQTHSGPVLLGLGAVPGFAVAATTYTGEIFNELPFETHGDDRSLEGRHGTGEPDISVSTFSGRIHLAPEAVAVAEVRE